MKLWEDESRKTAAVENVSKKAVAEVEAMKLKQENVVRILSIGGKIIKTLRSGKSGSNES